MTVTRKVRSTIAFPLDFHGKSSMFAKFVSGSVLGFSLLAASTVFGSGNPGGYYPQQPGYCRNGQCQQGVVGCPNGRCGLNAAKGFTTAPQASNTFYSSRERPEGSCGGSKRRNAGDAKRIEPSNQKAADSKLRIELPA
jgi:hypothetical protein